MANVAAQFGFQQFGYISGGSPDYQQNKGLIQSTYSTKIYFGDPVIKSAASIYIQQMTNNTSTAIWGIFVGCQYTPAGLAPAWSPYWPGAAGADATAYIIDAPSALFKVAAVLTTVPTTSIGYNIGFTTGAAATTFGGAFSNYLVDQSQLTTNSSFPFQVYSMYPGVGNGSDTTTNFNWIIVSFNNQRNRAGQTGIA
jgi:hypothetical protein